ncbi:TonB-dependent receptor [Flaviaesturariibacter amylovorans]|uniref:TonB-dependent receptor n=1 Tax=Flaviaesturariibacter amylovorans TaxID=1084520 RepID=A0ABP8HS01_9BACT
MHSRKPLLLSLTLLGTLASRAQTGAVQGQLRDPESGAALRGATVVLAPAADSTARKTLLTDSSGRFRFSTLPADSFVLRFSYSGYAPQERRFRLATGARLRLGPIDLARRGQELTGVVIQATPPPATQKADTLQLNASSYKVNPDASAEDLIRKMPGISVEGGQVKANGENVQKVTIDGKELFGDDATAALRNLPAEVIDKIQVFDRLSDQAQLTGVDDGNTQRSINIVTKVNVRNSQFGRFYAGYGTNNRYTAGGAATLLKEERRISLVANFNNVNQQNFANQDLLGVTANIRGRGRGPAVPGANAAALTVAQQAGINRTSAFGVNYNNKWGKSLILSGSYFYNYSRNRTYEEAATEYFSTGRNAFETTTDTVRSGSYNGSHRINARLEWRVDSVHTLVFTPALSFQDNGSERTVDRFFGYRTNGQGLTERYTSNRNGSDRGGNTINGSLLFVRRFARRGRSFSANVFRNSNERLGDTYIGTTDTRFYSTRAPFDTLTQRFTDQQSGGWQVGASLTWSEPLSPRSHLQLTYNPSIARATADQETYAWDGAQGKYSTFLAPLSNRFRNRTDAQNAGLSYRYGNRDLNFSGGLSFQHTRLRSDQQFPLAQRVDGAFRNLLPNAQMRWKVSGRSSLRFTYRASVNTPGVTQLQGVVNPGNPPLYSVGNPDLDPQYTHAFNGQYTFTNPKKGQLLTGNLFVQTANNFIASGTFQPQEDSLVAGTLLEAFSQLRKPVNLDGYRNVRGLVNYAFPLKAIKSNLSFNVGLNWNRLPGIVNNAETTTDNTVYSLGTVVASNVSSYVDFTISYTANKNDVRNRSSNSKASTLSYNYYQHVASVQLTLQSKRGWVLQTDAANQYFSGFNNNPAQQYTLWNMAVGKKFGKARSADLRLSVFDLLEQNQSIVRNVTDTYIENERTEVLQRYFLLTFTYNLRHFADASTRK